jgi:hypothetical protein
MKYIIMINVPMGTGDYESNEWAPQDVAANRAFMLDLNRELTESGELVAVHALAPPGAARVVRSADDRHSVTDGPFIETKEFLAGYWIVDVAGPERAYEIAARASAAPGRSGVPLNMPIEVREVIMSVEPGRTD